MPSASAMLRDVSTSRRRLDGWLVRISWTQWRIEQAQCDAKHERDAQQAEDDEPSRMRNTPRREVKRADDASTMRMPSAISR